MPNLVIDGTGANRSRESQRKNEQKKVTAELIGDDAVT
jgi:hypothetical protein